MGTSPRGARFRGALVGAGVALTALSVLIGLGLANPVRSVRVATDRLGPEHGELVAEYLARAGRSLPEDGANRWALMAFVDEQAAAGVAASVGAVRVSQVLFRVPIERVHTQLIVVDVPSAPDIAATVRAAESVAASRLQGTVGSGDRAGKIDAVSRLRLRADCACVVGVVVHGSRQQLRVLAGAAGVRAVEALPADAVWGKFAVTPLLPEQQQAVTPGPDDGSVPER